MEYSSASPSRKRRILLGVTGSVAAVKAPEIAVRLVMQTNTLVRVLLTKGGRAFWEKAKEYDPQNWEALERLVKSSSPEHQQQQHPLLEIFHSEDEWREWNRLGDPVMHIELRDWADILLIAPLSAHTLAKLAHGLCDDALSSVARAWDWGYHSTRRGKPVVLAPAMNTAMWQHPLTEQQLQTVQSFWNKHDSHNGCTGQTEREGVSIVRPQVKTLACGEIGDGALASVHEIVATVQRVLVTDQETTTVSFGKGPTNVTV